MQFRFSGLKRSLQTKSAGLADVPSTMTDSPTPLSPWDTVELGHGLSLVPRIRINFSFTRVDQSLRPLDEWQLKECLKVLLHKSISFRFADSDLTVSKDRQAHRRKRNEPVAAAVLYVWLSDQQGASVSPEQKQQQLQDVCVDKWNGFEMNVAGVKLRCHAEVMEAPSAESLVKSWEGVRDVRTSNAVRRPDTLIVRGVPSLWLSEPRVSSKASILVTHTIFSTFGGIRNLEVTSDGGVDIGGKQMPLSIAPALRCDVWVQFNKHSSLCKALEAFCGRSLAKEGTSLKTDCSVQLDKDTYFSEQNVRKRKFEKQNQEELGRRELANKIRLANLEARKAELAQVEHQKRQVEEAERALREEEEKRKQAEEDARVEEEMRLFELERLQAEAEDQRRREEEQLAQKIREEEERRQQEYEERKRIEELEAKRAKEEEEEERRLAAQRKEDARRLAAQEDIQKLEARRLMLEREMQRRTEEKTRQSGLHASGTGEVDEFDRWILNDSGSINFDTKDYLHVSQTLTGADSTVQLRKRISSVIVRI